MQRVARVCQRQLILAKMTPAPVSFDFRTFEILRIGRVKRVKMRRRAKFLSNRC